MPSPASLPASPANQDPTNLQYREASAPRLARDLRNGELPVVQAWLGSVAVLTPARKSPLETGDAPSKVRPRSCLAMSGHVVLCLVRMDRPGASLCRSEGTGPEPGVVVPQSMRSRDPAN